MIGNTVYFWGCIESLYYSLFIQKKKKLNENLKRNSSCKEYQIQVESK